MDSPYLNFPLGSQASGSGCSETIHSVRQDSHVPYWSALNYFPAASQKSYTLLGHDGGSSQVPQKPVMNSAQSFHPSVGSQCITLPSSRSGHPYQQARLCHLADRASARHQEWSQPSYPAVPALVPTSGATTQYDAMTGHRVGSNRCHDSSQVVAARRFTQAPAFGSGSQYNIVSSTNQNVPSFMDSFTDPRQLLLSTLPVPALTPCPPADQADIEYAQHHYRGKRCLYQCRFDLSGSPCNRWIIGDRTRVLRHLRNHHRLQTGPAIPAVCRWDKCTHSREMKQENLSRHIVMHLGVKWRCPHCRRLFSRDDAVHRHIERMVPGVDVIQAEVVPGREARAITESELKGARIA